MSKTPRQSNRHSRYDNAQHCALSAAYKKLGCTILTKKRCALKNSFKAWCVTYLVSPKSAVLFKTNTARENY